MAKVERVIRERLLKPSRNWGAIGGFSLSAGALAIGVVPAMLTGKDWLFGVGIGLYAIGAILALRYIRNEDSI